MIRLARPSLPCTSLTPLDDTSTGDGRLAYRNAGLCMDSTLPANAACCLSVYMSAASALVPKPKT